MIREWTCLSFVERNQYKCRGTSPGCGVLSKHAGQSTCKGSSFLLLGYIPRKVNRASRTRTQNDIGRIPELPITTQESRYETKNQKTQERLRPAGVCT